MLVLSRKQDQQIVIDDRITITVLKSRGNTVRIGIEAPGDVSIRRGELAEQPQLRQIVEFRNKTANGSAKTQLRIAKVETDRSSPRLPDSPVQPPAIPLTTDPSRP